MMIFTRPEFDCVVRVSLNLPARKYRSFNSTLKPSAKVVFHITGLNIVCGSHIFYSLYIKYKYSYPRKLRAKHSGPEKELPHLSFKDQARPNYKFDLNPMFYLNKTNQMIIVPNKNPKYFKKPNYCSR